MDDARASVDKYLEQHDYEAAAKAIELLPEKVHQHREIKVVEDQITRRRGAAAMYKLALRRFEIGDYPGVLSLLEPKEDEMDRALAMDPRRRRSAAACFGPPGVCRGCGAAARGHDVPPRHPLSWPGSPTAELSRGSDALSGADRCVGKQAQRCADDARQRCQAHSEKPPQWAAALDTLKVAKDDGLPAPHRGARKMAGSAFHLAERVVGRSETNRPRE